MSMKILRLANRGVSREEFLRDVLKTIQRFTEADEVRLAFSRGDHRTTWVFTGGGGNDRLTVTRQRNSGTEDGEGGSGEAHEDLVAALLTGARASGDSPLAKRGVVWIDGPAETLRVCLDDGPARTVVVPWPQAKASVAIPVQMDGRMAAVLVLLGNRGSAFSRREVEFVEGLAHTIGAAMADRAAQAALRERVKELGCLYELSQMAQRPGIEIDEVLERTVDILPPAFQYPELAIARIRFDDRIYASPAFRETDLKLASFILVDGSPRGSVEVRYHARKEEFSDRVFLDEEQKLLDAVARQIALIVEGRQAERERRELEAQLRHADRLATIGELAAGVAHEINEPLGNILGFAQLMEKDESLSDQSHHDCQRIVHAALHAREIVRKLLIFARQVQTQKGPVDLNRVIEDGLYFLESRCARHGIELVRELDRSCPPIVADEGQINQVLVNLVVNAIQAVPEGGRIIVTTVAEPRHVALVVEDTGAGLDESTLDRLFVPFYTTKEPGEGTGLGLSVVHGIVSAHGGTVHAENREAGGARFIAEFPLAQEDAE
jgi:signal transduction histidine kinase